MYIYIYVLCTYIHIIHTCVYIHNYIYIYICIYIHTTHTYDLTRAKRACFGGVRVVMHCTHFLLQHLETSIGHVLYAGLVLYIILLLAYAHVYKEFHSIVLGRDTVLGPVAAAFGKAVRLSCAL